MSDPFAPPAPPERRPPRKPRCVNCNCTDCEGGCEPRGECPHCCDEVSE